jgi:hypothetical protein
LKVISNSWAGREKRSGRYTSILTLAESGNERLLSLVKILHPLQRLLGGELAALGPALLRGGLRFFLGHEDSPSGDWNPR